MSGSWLRFASGGHLEALAALQHRPAHSCVLGRYGHHRSPVTSPFGQGTCPAAQRVLPGVVLAHGQSQHSPRTQYQQAAKVRVACLGDAPQPLFTARAVLPRHQPELGAELAATAEVVAVAHGADQCRGGGLSYAAELHELLGGCALACHGLDVAVVLGDALVEPTDFAEQVADDGVGPAGQVLQVLHRFAAHHGGFEWQHDAQLRQQAPDAVERGGALFDKARAGAVDHQLALLLDALGGHEAHVGAGNGFADRLGIGGVVLAAFAREAVGGDELGCHQAHGVAVLLKLACPVVGT